MQRKASLALCSSPDEIADKINSLALDILGDILLEDTGDGYEIIEDYKNLF